MLYLHLYISPEEQVFLRDWAVLHPSFNSVSLWGMSWNTVNKYCYIKNVCILLNVALLCIKPHIHLLYQSSVLAVCVCSEAQSRSTVCDPRDCRPVLFSPWNFPGKNTGVDYCFLLLGTSLAQISNPCLFCLLHWQADSLPLSHLGRYLPIFWQIKIALLQLGTIYSFFNIFFWFISSLLNSFVRFRVCFIESFISK